MTRTLSALLLLAAPAAFAQTVTKIAPLPAQWNLWGACFTTVDKGFVCGDMKGLMRTVDGGANWTKVDLPGDQTVPLYNVTFIDQNVGLVSGNSAQGSLDVFRTTDGGTTWNQVTQFPLGGSWYHQDYVSPTTGFMGCNGALVRSTDAGATWQLMSGYPSCPVIYGMDFSTPTTGFVAGYQIQGSGSGVYKTTDGGVTWQLSAAVTSNDVIYLAPDTLLAETGTGFVKSTDGGSTWTPTSGYVYTGIVDLEPVSPGVVVGVSAAGDIWRSPDGGSTWVQTWFGEGDLPGTWYVRFRDALNGVVVGVKGLMYASHDGGVTWTRMHRGIANEWNGVATFSDSRVVLVGHHGYVQTTADAGAHWDVQLLDPPVYLRDTSFSAVSAVAPGFAFATGHWGGMFKTLDGGKTWQNLIGTVSADYYPNDVKFTDALNGWMVGFDYTTGPKKYTQRTTDGGLSWQVVDGANIPGIAVDVRGLNVWVQTSGAPHWRSTDGGKTFAMVQLPANSGSSPSCMDMSFATDKLGYVCGFDGYLVKTVNGGQTWSTVGSTVYQTTYVGVTAVANELWVCGARQGGGSAFVKRSLDGGSTWTTWSLPGQYTTPYKMERTGTHLYVTGYNGETWRFDGLRKIPSTIGPIAH